MWNIMSLMHCQASEVTCVMVPADGAGVSKPMRLPALDREYITASSATPVCVHGFVAVSALLRHLFVGQVLHHCVKCVLLSRSPRWKST
jgi:hypothetical protein